MKVKVIGGSGFVGTRLIDLLKQKSIEIQNLDKRDSVYFSDSTVIVDVRDKEALKTLLKDTDIVVLLAAEHKDDVLPVSLYYDVNVTGLKNVLVAMENNGIKRIIFTSSVAIYGLNKNNPNEKFEADPFNHYGKSKWQAELVLQEWYKNHLDWNIQIIRPTVIFGEQNRGNVYNLLKQISSGKFWMVGKGDNKKSMAYVGNIVSFIYFLMKNEKKGYDIYNYVDKPDMDMNELITLISNVLDKHIPSIHLPYWIGFIGGFGFDVLSKIMNKKLSISSVRVKKFCATTQFDATKVSSIGFIPPYSLIEGLSRTLKSEFLDIT